MARMVLLLVETMLVVSSCGETPQREATTATSLEQLRWLAGTWRGTENGQHPFFEGYEFTSDSLLRIRYYADSTTTVVADSGTVYVRGGAIYHQTGGATWRAVELDTASIRFEPYEHADNAFSWVRVGPDTWTATIERPGSAPTVYRLARLRSDR